LEKLFAASGNESARLSVLQLARVPIESNEPPRRVHWVSSNKTWANGMDHQDMKTAQEIIGQEEKPLPVRSLPSLK
jgi:hypothetical protein